MSEKETRENVNEMENEWDMLQNDLFKDLEGLSDEMVDLDASMLDELENLEVETEEETEEQERHEDAVEEKSEVKLEENEIGVLDDIVNGASEDEFTLEQFDAFMGDSVAFEGDDMLSGIDFFGEQNSTTAGDVYSAALGAVSDIHEGPDTAALEAEFDQMFAAELQEDKKEKVAETLLPEDAVEKAERKKAMREKMFSNASSDEVQLQEVSGEEEIDEEELERQRLKEEKKQKKLEEKAKKKEEKKAAKAAKKAEKAKQLAEKKAKKAKELEEYMKNYVPEPPLNKSVVSLVGVTAAVVAGVIIGGCMLIPKGILISNGEYHNKVGRYSAAYEDLSGLELKGSDEKLYEQLQTIMLVNKQQNSYTNFIKMGMPVEALDSLLKGLERYEEFYGRAKEHGVQKEYDDMKKTMLSELKKTYNLTEKDAKSLIAITDKEAYTKRLTQIANTVA